MRVTDIYMAFLSFNDFVFTEKKSSVLVVCCAPVFVVKCACCAELMMRSLFSLRLYTPYGIP